MASCMQRKMSWRTIEWERKRRGFTGLKVFRWLVKEGKMSRAKSRNHARKRLERASLTPGWFFLPLNVTTWCISGGMRVNQSTIHQRHTHTKQPGCQLKSPKENGCHCLYQIQKGNLWLSFPLEDHLLLSRLLYLPFNLSGSHFLFLPQQTTSS